MNIRIDATLERDIDLLIMEEFISDPQFAKIFLEAIDIKENYFIEKAIHSKTDALLGESDLVFVLSINGKKHAIHIEDKIDAMAMPAQHDRYIKRAEKDVSAGEYDTYSVFIVAPDKYLQCNTEAQKYEHAVQYEQLRSYFASKDDLRSQYKLALIDRAITEQKNGYQYEADPRMVDFCVKMNEYQKSKGYRFPNGTISWWPSYHVLLKGADIVLKANKGSCDLQFSNTQKKDLYFRVKDYISDGMYVVQAAKSASVRIDIPPIFFESKFEDNIDKVDKALDAITKLFELSLQLLENEDI